MRIVTGLYSTWQDIQMPCRCVGGPQAGQRINHQPRSGGDQLIVVDAGQQTLAILVGLPGRVENAGYQAAGLSREERPKLLHRGACGFERSGPLDANAVRIIKGAAVILGRIGELVLVAEQLPPRTIASVIEPDLPTRADPANAARLAVGADQIKAANVRHEQQKLGREGSHLFRQTVECSVLDRQAHNVPRPTHELGEIRVRIRCGIGIGGFSDAEHRVILRVRRNLGDPLPGSPPVKLDRAAAAEHGRFIRDAQDRLETDAETPDLGRSPLGREMREEQCPCAILVERCAIVRAVEMGVGELDVDPPAAGFGELIGTVLHKLNDLASRVAAASGVLLLIRLFVHEIGLGRVGVQRPLRFRADVPADLAVNTCPLAHLPT